MDENDCVYHPQTGERLLIPQVCCECGSDDLVKYVPDGDFLPLDGWRLCRDCEAAGRNPINPPIPQAEVCPECGGFGGHLIYAFGLKYETPDCQNCGGKGRVWPKREDD